MSGDEINFAQFGTTAATTYARISFGATLARDSWMALRRRNVTSRASRGAAAGVIAAAVWAVQQPLDKRVFRSGYDDLELLGKLVTRRSWWPIPGLALHLGNGAAFGAVYALVCPKLPGPAWARGVVVAQAENFGLWPLVSLTDRHHPAREELPRLTGNRRALAQATWRHALFGLVLGAVEARLQRRRRPAGSAIG
jgi:hypothetical protein